MKKRLMAGFGAAALLVAATTGVASADAPDPTGFVCPVLGGEAGVNGEADVFAAPQGPDAFYTIIGPLVGVPTGATNDDGAGSPGGDYASPGDSGYTAIWDGLPG